MGELGRKGRVGKERESWKGKGQLERKGRVGKVRESWKGKGG